MTTPNVQVRRPVASRFVPRPADQTDETRLVRRNVLQATRSVQERATKRERLIAGDLPDWDPLPPGELLVKRGA